MSLWCGGLAECRLENDIVQGNITQCSSREFVDLNSESRQPWILSALPVPVVGEHEGVDQKTVYLMKEHWRAAGMLIACSIVNRKA